MRLSLHPHRTDLTTSTVARPGTAHRRGQLRSHPVRPVEITPPALRDEELVDETTSAPVRQRHPMVAAVMFAAAGGWNVINATEGRLAEVSAMLAGICAVGVAASFREMACADRADADGDARRQLMA